jgi:hypothetical protein
MIVIYKRKIFYSRGNWIKGIKDLWFDSLSLELDPSDKSVSTNGQEL